jgi:Regulator of chromosome condensation (RCC1) repeat
MCALLVLLLTNNFCIARDSSCKAMHVHTIHTQGYGNVANVVDPSTSGDVVLGEAMYAVAISAGGDNTCALLSSTKMICWGNGAFGLGITGPLGDNEVSIHVYMCSIRLCCSKYYMISVTHMLCLPLHDLSDMLL